MKNASIFIAFLSIILFSSKSGFSQKFQVPADYKLETVEDFRRYDKDIIKCADWLEKAKISDDNKNLQSAINFIAEWVSGCPYVEFSQNVRVDILFNDNPKLRVYYMGGWARNVVQKQGKTSKVENCVAGLRSAIKVYKANKSLERNSSFDEIIKIDNEGKLFEWVADRIE